MTAPNTHVPASTDANGAIAITPQTGAPVSATTKASQEALARINAGGSAAPTPAPAPAAPQQPRASDGTFGTPLPPDPNAPPAPNAAPEAGREGQSPEGAAPEGEQPPAKTPEEIAAEEAAAARLVTLEVDGTPVDLDVGDPALAEVVRTSLTTAREAEAIRADAEREINDALAIRDFAEIDPVGFVTRTLAESPAGQEHLVLSLLTQPAVLERVRDRVVGMLNDPAKLELEQARQQAARVTFAEQARSVREEQAAVRENLADVQASCAAMARLIPNEALAGTAYNDFLRDLMAYADQANVTTIPPESIPVILTRRLTALGVDPMQAASAATKALAARPSSASSPSRGGRSPAPRATVPGNAPMPRPAPGGAPAARPAPTPPNGQTFVASAQQRRTVAAIPAAGAGSPAVGPDLVPPKKADGRPMSTAETIAWHREQVRLGKRGLVVAR